MALLEVHNLCARFVTHDGEVPAVDGVSFVLEQGRTLGVVGESGSGKSVSMMAMLRLLPSNCRVSGSALFDGCDLLQMHEDELLSVRGNRIAMIFQDPMSSLNPFLTVERQLTEVLQTHKGMNRRAALDRSVEMLELVGIPDPHRRVHDYPHQFSGGMRQRVMIAMALLCEPKLLIADEPTTALDVTIQAQILDLLRKLSREFETSIIMITHDLGVVAGMCDDVAVMYAGRVVEQASAQELFSRPRHPYTRGLLASVPKLNGPRGEMLDPIPGQPANALHLPQGCHFRPRCAHAVEQCMEYPPAMECGTAHFSRCWRAQELK